MSNKKLGNDFEQEVCDILSTLGWWSHNLAQNKAGQPADVIAVKDDFAILIDCKVCSHDRFPVSRMEDNQRLSMQLWHECGNYRAYFAMKLTTGTIHMVPYRDLVRFEEVCGKTMYFADIIGYPTIQDVCGGNQWI